MYRAREKQMSIYDYLPPYHGELCNANRWVRLAEAIDWDGFEKAYSELFAPSGKVALPARIALGCRIIQLERIADLHIMIRCFVLDDQVIQCFRQDLNGQLPRNRSVD